MKSAAFNLAFKVHRNELPFAQGLLKSVEASAQEDFIEALNSLAGSTKYNVEQLDQLIEQAKQELTQEKAPSKVDVSKLEEEIKNLKNDKRELKSSISLLETQMEQLIPTIIPGINSMLLFLVGLMVVLILFVMGLTIVALISVLITLGLCAFLFMQDMNKLNKQKEDIARKKEKSRTEIDKVNEAIQEINKKIKEKEEAIEKQKNKQPTPPPTPEDPSLPSLV